MNRSPARGRAALSCALIVCLELLPVARAVAQVPAIADDPLFTLSTVKANLMMTLDNSGSMGWQFAPMNTSANKTKRCYTNFNYNRLYYNPNNTYLPPVKADGTRYPDSSFNGAWRDGFTTTAGTRDLRTQFPAVNNYGDTALGTASRSAFYYNYTGTSPATPVVGTCYADASYTLVDMNLATTAQKTNFANWFSYYRFRMNAMKTSAGEAFRVVDDTFRVGLHTINSPGGTGSSGAFLGLDTFTGTQKTNWYTRFYQQIASGSTPLRAAQQRIGEYYRAGTSPAGGSVPDPIQYSCQQNYHLLTTDGQWNSSGASGTVGSTNYDNTLPANPDLLTALNAEFGTSFTAGGAWPRPYREKPGSPSTNTLADVAAYYWMTDLRPTMTNNVFTSSTNMANWQHMVTYGLSFSEKGAIAYPTGLPAVIAGTSDWPVPAADSASAIDDLWHAALIGHGQYFNVASPQELVDALGRAISDIQARQGSNSGAVLTGSDFAQGTPIAFRAQYKTGEWSGDLQARTVDPSTGVISASAVWKAQEKLEAQVLPAGSGGGWSTNRKIVTRSDSSLTGTAVRFREPGASGAGGAISTTQLATLDADTAKAQKLLHYLRGDRSNEDTLGVTNLFRRRTFVLGDIVSSEPRYVGAPTDTLSDAYHPGYSAYKSSTSARAPMVYVGANDGMMHAFKATTGEADSGQEKWAYVPSFLFRAGVDGLGSLGWRPTDPLPNKFYHRFRVDQTPTIADVNFGRVKGGASVDWRTMLVSGLYKGGKGYFALDVTDPEAASEDALRSKVLWEFDGSQTGDTSRVGYSYGQPLPIFTNYGWVIAVSSGYQNATGTGHIWLLDPRNGQVIKRLDVPDNAGATATNPIGLAHMEVFFQSDREQRTQELYATDLRGNVWRWDLNGATAAAWPTDGVKIASVGAPITSSPAIAMNPRDRSERWVFFGTGRLMATTDLSSGSTRTFYAIKDGSANTPATVTTPLGRSDLVAVTPSGTAPQGPSVKGWYMDMTVGGGGQIIIPPHVARGVVMWGSTVPTTDPCSPGANAVFYAREIGSAGNRLNSGDFYVQLNAPVTKIQVAQSNQPGGGTNSQRKQLAIASTSGSDIVIDVNMQVVLTGGRSNLRFITTQ